MNKKTELKKLNNIETGYYKVGLLLPKTSSQPLMGPLAVLKIKKRVS